MTKEKEVFKPIVKGKVGMYICGVTAYDLSHIGHARACVAFDVLYRFLRYLGYGVVYVRNSTNVDDKIISNGCAYAVDGDVYFSVDEFPNYGCLSGLKLADTRAGERVAGDSRKRNPADFALCKAAKPEEPKWNSHWGPGRPGWHIECSVMSTHYLTPAFDIHGSGMDLIFPHHEIEIAQNYAASANLIIGYIRVLLQRMMRKCLNPLVACLLSSFYFYFSQYEIVPSSCTEALPLGNSISISHHLFHITVRNFFRSCFLCISDIARL